jgi:hypothetical protein
MNVIVVTQSKVVEQLTLNPKVHALNPSTSIDRKKMGRKKYLYAMVGPPVAQWQNI